MGPLGKAARWARARRAHQSGPAAGVRASCEPDRGRRRPDGKGVPGWSGLIVLKQLLLAC